jgi:hypothetical protein
MTDAEPNGDRPVGELINRAREHIGSLMADLEGDDDFMPFMLITGPKEDVYVGVVMPKWGSPRDDIADVMMALLAMHRATEAVFASSAWMLSVSSEEERKQWGNRSFEEHPDRKEGVFMVYAGPAGDQFHAAPIIRENNTVTLGDWTGGEYDGEHPMAGRFGKAMHRGLQLVRDMPAEMVEMIEAAVAAGDEEAVMAPMMNSFRRIRTGDFTAEEMQAAKRLAEDIGVGEYREDSHG